MREFTSSMVDDLPVGVAVLSVPEGKVVYANEAFVDILGTEPHPDGGVNEATDQYGVRDPDGAPYPVEKLPFSRALATGGSVTVDDMVIHRRDGRRVPVRAFGKPVRDAERRITHVIVAFIDVSVEMQVKAEHATLESRLKLIADHAPLAYFCIDLDGKITLSEGAGLKRLGVGPGDLVGSSVFELYADHPTIPGYMRRALAGESFRYSVTVGDATFDSWLTPLCDEEGRIIGAAGVSNDVTEIHALQAAAIQSDRVMAMGTLAASVAHEINNPLTYILTSLDQLEKSVARHAAALRADPNAAVHERELARIEKMLVPVRQGFERIASITRELRTFSRPDDQRLEPLDVRHVVSAVLNLVRKEIEARAELTVSMGQDVVVLGNEARLVQVVTNLTMNALQALPEDAPGKHTIEVSAQRQGDRVVIEVGDSGPGVPAADRERIFEPFVTTKAIGAGTGLGLFVCRNIVRDLGGEISVQDRPGGGALFRVSLPAAPRSARSTDVRDAPRYDGVGGRVLLVDDDPAVALSFANCLTAAGIQVEIAADGRQALDRLVSGAHFDLTYCDLMMSGMTGMELADELISRQPELLERVVFMTGGAFTTRAAAFAGEHLERIVEKPFDIVADVRARLGEVRS